jgi:polysaccharide pyruvyl transferase CsaB
MSARASSRRVTIVGYYGFRNAGDEVILTAMLRDLRRRPKLDITVASASPRETAETYGVASFLWSDTHALMNSVESADLVIVGGGGLFHDSFGFDPDAFLTDQQTGIAYYTAPVFLAALSRRPVMLYAVGAGPLLSEQGKLFTRIAGGLATAITVRDEPSRDILLGLGVNAHKIVVTADPAFSFAAEVADTAGKQAPPGGNPVVAVSVRHWDRDIAPAFWERELARALDLIVERRDADILFVPFQCLEGQPEDDAAVACRVRQLMRRSERASMAPHALGPDAILETLRNCHAVLGMRLHSVILGLCAGLPVVALSYEPKVAQAMARAGLADRTVDLRAFDAPRLADLLDESLAAGAGDAGPNLHALAAEATRNATIALDLLKKPAPATPSLATAFELLPRIVRVRVEEARAMQAEHRRCITDVAVLMARAKELDTELEQRGAAREALALRIQDRDRELHDLGAIRRIQADEISARDRELERLHSERESLADDISARDRELERLRSERESLEAANSLLTQTLNDQLATHRGQAAAWSEENAVLQESRDQLSRELAEASAAVSTLRAETKRLLTEQAAAAAGWAGERDSLEADNSRLTQKLDEQLSFARRQAAAWIDQIGALTETRDRLSRELAEARASAARAANEQRAVSSLLKSTVQDTERQFEELRQAVLSGAGRYDRDFQDRLTTYRNQRAWQLMLLARKAYTLLHHEGWKGRFDLIGLACRTVARAPLELAPYDLTFPPVHDYLPEQVFVAPKPADPSAAVSRLYDVLVFPVFDFEFRFQRPQQIAAELARRGHRVFWVSPSRCLPESSPDPFKLVELRDNLHEVQLRRGPFDLYGGSLADGDEAMAVESLAELYRERNIAESMVLMQFPFWRRFGKALKASFGACLVYDQMDDWRNWPSEPRVSAFNIDEERLLQRESDVLVVTASEFARRAEARTPPPCMIPNAADFDFFNAAPPRPSPASRPVIGYYGAIAAWFDLDLAVKTAAARPQYDFVFIGGVHGRDVTALTQLPNVSLPGEKHYRELPSLLAGFDVCLIPFALNRLTHSVDPVKVYEYLSQGKPVVATKMAELAPLSDVIYLADDPDDFLRCVDHAVRESAREDAPARRAERIAFARRNTWAARADVLCDAVNATFPLISIVVLTHNSQDYIELCCESIRSNTSWPRYEVIFVDNASTDRTVPILADLARADSRIRVVELCENTGFAAGNNRGVAEAAGEYLVILNPDTIPSQGWLHRLIRHLRTDSALGMIAPVTNHSGNETRIDAGYRSLGELETFAAERARLYSGQRRELTMAPLLCVMLRRDLWNRIGELDERFKVGMFEDDDYSRRVRNAGYRIATAEDCFVHHFGSGSFAQLQPEEALAIFARNRLLYETKWNVPWEEHRSRDNVRPLASAVRLSPRDFRGPGAAKRGVAGRRPSILKLSPDATSAGQPMNRQPDGAAALVVDCVRATPDTVVRWNEVLLRTSFGSPEFLTAVVPPELYSTPGEARVTLLNDFGISDAFLFSVQ